MEVEVLYGFGLLASLFVGFGFWSQKERKDVRDSNARIKTILEKKNQEMKYQLDQQEIKLDQQEIEIKYLEAELEKNTLKKEKELIAKMREYRKSSDSWSAQYFEVAEKLRKVTVVEEKVLDNVYKQRSMLSKNNLTIEDRKVVKLSLKANKNKMLRNPAVYSELLLSRKDFSIMINSINEILEED